MQQQGLPALLSITPVLAVTASPAVAQAVPGSEFPAGTGAPPPVLTRLTAARASEPPHVDEIVVAADDGREQDR